MSDENLEKSELEKSSLSFSSNNSSIKIKENADTLNILNEKSMVVLGPADENNGKSKDNVILYDSEGNQRFNTVWSYIYENDDPNPKDVINLTEKIANFNTEIKKFNKNSVKSFQMHNSRNAVVNISSGLNGIIIVSGGYTTENFVFAYGQTRVNITKNGNPVIMECSYGGSDNNPFFYQTKMLQSGTYNISIVETPGFSTSEHGSRWGNVGANVDWTYTLMTFPIVIEENL